MDLYDRMGHELRVLFNDLFDLKRSSLTQERMGKILRTACEIGGSIEREANELKGDIERFFAHPKDPNAIENLKRHALRLKQETREI